MRHGPRRHTSTLGVAAIVVATTVLSSARPIDAPEPSTLAVRSDGEWMTWWRSDQAPPHWPAALDEVAGNVDWEAVRPGLEVGELLLAGQGLAWRTRIVMVRMEPHRFWFRLEQLQARSGGGAWTVWDATPEAAVALNAGQFTASGPWGWVVRDGRETQYPGFGPLSFAVAFDSSGGVQWIAPEDIERRRASLDGLDAFQSYPTLLVDDGRVPAPLMAEGHGVDLVHRDTRLALCELRDGRLLIALSRFAGLGGALESLPFGLTTPETAALMGSLGCHVAVMLDGGISAQLLVRDQDDRPRHWRGWRRVPLGLIAVPRP